MFSKTQILRDNLIVGSETVETSGLVQDHRTTYYYSYDERPIWTSSFRSQ